MIQYVDSVSSTLDLFVAASYDFAWITDFTDPEAL